MKRFQNCSLNFEALERQRSASLTSSCDASAFGGLQKVDYPTFPLTSGGSVRQKSNLRRLYLQTNMSHRQQEGHAAETPNLEPPYQQHSR